jgi:hypothetical protein
VADFIQLYQLALTSLFLSALYWVWLFAAVVVIFMIRFYTTCIRTKGTIVGFAQSGACYFPVVEFMTREGATHRERNDTGLSVVDSNLIGRQTTVLYSIDRAGGEERLTVHIPNFTVSAIVVSAILCIGGGGFLIVNAALHPRPIHFLGAALICVVGILRSKLLREILAALMSGKKVKSLAAMSPSVELVPVEQLQTAQAAQNAAVLKVPFNLIAVMGAILIVFGVFVAQKTARLANAGGSASGHIVGFQSSTDSKGHTNYYPMVEFQDGGRTIKFNDRVGSSIRMPQAESVPVIYDPNEPSNAMIDRGIWNWLPAAALLLFGAILLLISARTRAAVAAMRTVQKFTPGSYTRPP